MKHANYYIYNLSSRGGSSGFTAFKKGSVGRFMRLSVRPNVLRMTGFFALPNGSNSNVCMFRLHNTTNKNTISQ